jgi:hypothetical protein
VILDAMKYITICGNCQAEALAKLIKIGLSEVDWQVEYFSNNNRLCNMKSVQEIIQGIKRSDIFIYQPLGESHGELSENNIRQIVKQETDMISFTYIFNSGMYSMGHAPMVQKHSYGIVYGEEIIVELLKQYDVHTIIDFYRKGLINFDLINRFQTCMAEMKRREEKTDIKLSGFIQDNYQKSKLLITHNHPTTRLFIEICCQVKRLTRLPFSSDCFDIEKENIANLPEPTTPISPYDVKTHGYRFAHHEDWVTEGTNLIKLISDHYFSGDALCT